MVFPRFIEQIREKLHIEPAKIFVERHIRYKYACKKCEGVESEGPTVKVAPPPTGIIPKGIATPGLLAYIAVSKYADALPLYRQEMIFSRLGIDLPRSTMAGWMVKVAECAGPVMTQLQKEFLSHNLINADETRVQVLNEPGRPNTSQSCMWVFRGGPQEKPVILYRYSTSHSGDIPRQILQGYHGYLQTDAFSAYNGLEKEMPGIILVGCFAHVRRNFINVIDARGKDGEKKTGHAEAAMDYIGQLYGIEKFAREKKLSADEIYDLRNQKAQPIVGEFKSWMEELVNKTPPKGLLGKALNYALTRWPKLIRYLEAGHIQIDNNWAENAIRPFVVGRKNWLFAGHPNGAHAAATLYSLIETSKACGLEPYRYLRFLFKKLPHAQSYQDCQVIFPQYAPPEQLALYTDTQCSSPNAYKVEP